MRDNSTEIAWLQALLQILNDLDPNGEWRNEPIYRKWQSDHYSLSRREFHHLVACLDDYRKRAEQQLIKRELNYG